MPYEDNKVDKALDMIGMYSSFEEIKENMGLNKSEFSQLVDRARKRYGNDIFGH